MTKEQISERNIFIDKISEGAWNPGTLNTLFESGVKVSPEAHAEYTFNEVYLYLEYHAKERYLSLLIRTKDLENSIQFRFYYGEYLKQALNLIVNFQNKLSPYNYTDLVREMSEVCEDVFLEVEGQPLLRVTYGDKIASDSGFDWQQVNQTDIARLRQEPVNPEIEVFTENTQPELLYEKEEDEDESVDNLLAIIRAANAISQLSLQQLRVAKIIAKALRIEPDLSKDFLNEDNLLRNSCEWIEFGKCELVVLMPTHDGASRDPRRGVAYFDRLVKYPDREGEYPPESSVKDSPNICYRPADSLGGMTNGGKLLEIINLDRLSDSELCQFLIREVQHGIAQRWLAQPLRIGDKTTVDKETTLISGNLINSVRIQNLSEAIASCTSSMDISAGKVQAMFKKARTLDKIDCAFLGDELRSKVFWSLADKNLSSTILNELHNILM